MNTIQKPDKQYLETAQELKTLHESGEASKRWEERRRLQNSLRRKFEMAFGFLPDRKRLTGRFYWRFINTEVGPVEKIFDHVEFYQRGETLVIVSQPYGIEEAELKRWANECGAAYTVANEWGYYYPGHASLFFLEFSSEAKAVLDKRIRNN